MKDYAILGSYYSDKMLVTAFNIDKSLIKETKQSQRRKLVGEVRQNVSLTLNGFLLCSTFEELQKELDALVYALNRPEVAVVLGDRPERYYVCSWNATSAPRQPGAGGTSLPFSLSFDVLEEAAYLTAPAVVGWRNDAGVYTSQEGRRYLSTTVRQARSLFGAYTVPVTSSTGFYAFEGLLYLGRDGSGQPYVRLHSPADGQALKTVTFPNASTVKLGVVVREDQVDIYVNGIRYEHFQKFPIIDFLSKTDSQKLFELVLDAPIPDEYLQHLMTFEKDTVIRRLYFSGGAGISTIYYEGTGEAGIALHSESKTTLVTYEMNDFGAKFTAANSGPFLFNGITGEVTAQDYSDLDSLDYNGKKRILPYLEYGYNTLIKTGGVATEIFYIPRMI